jgi:addiction module HigA family antidote
MNINHISHAGEIFKDLVLEDSADLNITKAANLLGVTRVTLSRVVNGQASLSPELASRIEVVFAIKASILLKIQASYDSYGRCKPLTQVGYLFCII